MSRVVGLEYVSLDGVIQAPGDPHEDPEGFSHGGWTRPFFDDHRRYIGDAFRAAGAFLFGRITYEIFARYWPTVTAEDDDIARALNTLPKYVASRTLTDPPWRPTTVLSGELTEEVARLKHLPGKDVVVVGSGELAQTLIGHDLVDQYQLWIHPIVLGSGKRLFRGLETPAPMRLVDSRTTAQGLVILTCERIRPRRADAAAA